MVISPAKVTTSHHSIKKINLKKPNMIRNLLFAFAALMVASISAQPELVVDYNTGSEDAFDCFLCTEQPTARVGTGIVTVATTAETGAELCFLDEGQFSLLKDINPGADDGGIALLTSRNGLAYFAASDPENGGAVWVSDGTEEGTVVYFDPDPANTSGSITGMEFGADGALYVFLQSTLYRFFDGVGTQLATGVTISTARDNFPGGGMTPYQDGVAYLSNGSETANGGLFYAADTVRRLATIPGQRDFDQAFDPQAVNGNLLFSLSASGNNPERQAAYAYDFAADTLIRYLGTNGESLFANRWYEVSDGTRVGRVQVGRNSVYYAFDGINNPVQLPGAGEFTLAARQTAPAVRAGDTLVWQTEGGVFSRATVRITDGTPAGTTTVFTTGFATRVTNLIQAGGYVFFAVDKDSRNPLTFYRYELATGTLTDFHSVPVPEEGNPDFSLQLLAVQDSKLYFAGNLIDSLGRELYGIDTGVEIVATRNQRNVPQLDVTVTSENFTINSVRNGMANLTVLSLDGRLISRAAVPVNSATFIGAYSGIRLYVFEYDGRVAVRRILGRR